MKTIFRVEKAVNPFAQIDRKIFENASLSWKAKGLLGYLLSRPDNWRVIMGDLVNRSSDGESSIRSALDELQKAGYARYTRQRGPDGRVCGTCWTINENPQPPEAGQNEEPEPEDAQCDPTPTPQPVFPHVEKPRVENRPLSNKEENNNKKPSSFHEETKPVNELAEEARRFVDYFIKLLATTGAPNQRMTPTIRKGWEDTYQKLRRIDGRTAKEISLVCEWGRNDGFWSTNFFSPNKLRERKDGISRYDLFLSKLQKPNGNTRSQKPNSRDFEMGARAIGTSYDDLIAEQQRQWEKDHPELLAGHGK